MTPYESIVDVVVADTTKPHMIEHPTRVGITKIRVTGTKSATFNVTIYTRAFSATAVAIQQIVNDGHNYCLIDCVGEHGLQVGDTVVVATSGVAGYNTNHVVTAVLDEQTVVTNQAYSVDASIGGSLTLAIPGGQWGNYEFQRLKAADADFVYRFDEAHGLPYVNQDPLYCQRRQQKIYFLFSVADTYRVTITSLTDWT